jgi:predicted esterase YcpF (UPF0227 family)
MPCCLRSRKRLPSVHQPPITPLIVYVHGFNSSAQSFKARLIGSRMVALERAADFCCPDLDHRPARAITQLEAVLAKFPEAVLVGSSLGGFYATHLAEKHGLRAVLVNPAVRPYDLLRGFVGPQRNLYTGAEYAFTEQHLAELRALEVPRISPQRYLLLVTTGDEVLDYRSATTRYAGCEQMVIPDGDHGFGNFGDYLDRVLAFCGIPNSIAPRPVLR